MVTLDEFFAPSAGLFIRLACNEESVVRCTPKQHIRTMLDKGVALSVPVEGGNSLLKSKRTDINSVMISQHGDWQRQHLGAWKAIYGKTPYFQHIFPEMERIYLNYSYGKLRDFNCELNRLAFSLLDIEDIRNYLDTLPVAEYKRALTLKNELLPQISMDKTIFDTLFKHGKESGLLFIKEKAISDIAIIPDRILTDE